MGQFCRTFAGLGDLVFALVQQSVDLNRQRAHFDWQIGADALRLALGQGKNPRLDAGQGAQTHDELDGPGQQKGKREYRNIGQQVGKEFLAQRGQRRPFPGHTDHDVIICGPSRQRQRTVGNQDRFENRALGLFDHKVAKNLQGNRRSVQILAPEGGRPQAVIPMGDLPVASRERL